MKVLNKRGKILTGAVFVVAALLTGCGNSDNFVFTNQINQSQPIQPQDAPIASNDTFQALGNATLNQAAPGVLANDTVNGAGISEFNAVGSQGGAITLNADGSFTYSPVIGFVGSETFTYTLTNETGSSTATVTLTSTGFGRFVDNSAPDGGTGTQAAPFDTLAEAVAAAQPGDTIYVAQGNAKYLGGLTIPPGVNLVGEGTGLILGQTIEPAGTAPVLEGPLRPMGDNTITGVTVDDSVDTNLVQILNVSNVTITECTFSNPDGGEFIVVEDVGGTLSLTDNRFEQPDNTNEIWIDFSNDDTDATVSMNDNLFVNEAAHQTDNLIAIEAGGTTALVVDLTRNIADGALPGSFSYGFYVESANVPASSVSLTCQDNVFTNFSDSVIDVESPEGTISGNTITGCQSGMSAILGAGTLTISGNTVQDATNQGLYISDRPGTGGTFIVTDNVITNPGSFGIEASLNTDQPTRMAVRNNSITNSFSDAINIRANTDVDICVEVVGNTVDNNMRFDQNGSGMLNIERRGQLLAINTFTSGIIFFEDNTADVPAGSCMIP